MITINFFQLRMLQVVVILHLHGRRPFDSMMLALQALMTLGFEAKSTDILANMQQRLIKCTARFVAESVVTSS